MSSVFSCPDDPLVVKAERDGGGYECEVYGYCCECGGEVYDGQTCFVLRGELWCEKCVCDCSTMADCDRLEEREAARWGAR